VDQPFEVVFQLVFLASLAPLPLVLLLPLFEFFLAALVPLFEASLAPLPLVLLVPLVEFFLVALVSVFEASQVPWELSLLEAGALPEQEVFPKTHQVNLKLK
jgi:hypothetical protein